MEYACCVAEIQLDVKEMTDGVSTLSDGMSTLTVADSNVAPKYDDPYEENPLAAKRLCNGVEQNFAEVTRSDVVTAESTCETERGTLTAVSDCTSATGCSAVPVRSFELSAEYGGFFVASAVTEQSSDNNARYHADRHVEALPQQAAVENAANAAGLYDEPWDLSTVKHSIEEQLREKDIVRSVVDDRRLTTGDVYAQPNKAEKRNHRTTCSNTTDARLNDGRSCVNDGARVIDGPSYGILCERPAPPLARRQPATRHNQPGTWTTDSRPVDDYDIPWDQKKRLGGQTSKTHCFYTYTVVIWLITFDDSSVKSYFCSVKLQLAITLFL